MSNAVTQVQFAELLGVHKSHVTRLKQAGRLVLDENGRVLVEESRRRIEETEDPGRRDVAERWQSYRNNGRDSQGAADQENRIGNTYQAARAVKERFLAMAAKRDYEISIGKLLDAAEVESFMAEGLVVLRTRLERLPSVLGSRLAAENDEHRCISILAEEVEMALTELSRQFARTMETQDKS